MSKQVMLAGAGGINSWLVRDLYDLVQTSQLPADVEFTIYDGDLVEEKNLLYQNFTISDVLKNKADSLSERYLFFSEPKYIEDPKDFKGYDIIICGVDNAVFRKMLFQYVMKNDIDFWMDLRAEGTRVAAYCKHKNQTLKGLVDTLPKDAGNDTTSCQLAYELEAGIVQLGNRIIATIGAQFLLNHFRNEPVPSKYVQVFS